MSTVDERPNYDGHIIYESSGTGAVPSWVRVTDRPVIGLTGNLVGADGAAYRGFLDFDDSELPPGYLVSQIDFNLYTAEAVNNPNDFHIYGMATRAQDEADTETLYNNIPAGNVYNTNVNFDSIGWHMVTLGGDAVTDFNSNSRISLGLKLASEEVGAGTATVHYIKFYSLEEEEGDDLRPYITITYTVVGSTRRRTAVIYFN